MYIYFNGDKKYLWQNIVIINLQSNRTAHSAEL